MCGICDMYKAVSVEISSSYVYLSISITCTHVKFVKSNLIMMKNFHQLSERVQALAADDQIYFWSPSYVYIVHLDRVTVAESVTNYVCPVCHLD